VSARFAFAAGAATLLIALGGCTTTRHLPTIIGRPAAIPESDFASALADAQSMYLQREYGLAIGSFRVAIRLAPDDARGYDGLAACYDMLGRFDLSRRYYELALAFAPVDARIYRNLAQSLRMQGRNAEATAVLAEASALPVAAVPVVAMVTEPPRQTAATAAPVAPPEGWRAPEPAASVALALEPAPPALMPDWSSRLLRALAHSVALVVEPVVPAPDEHPPMLILNANGRTGLAASARERLSKTAWRAARIANAPPHAVSEIVYPSSRPAFADAIRARMPFPVRLHPSRSATRITLWLGADATTGAQRGQRG